MPLSSQDIIEVCGEYLSKGRQVYAEGRLQTRSWEKDGVTRYTTEIVASNIQFLGGKDSASNTGSYANTPESSDVPGPPSSEPGDDIPF